MRKTLTLYIILSFIMLAFTGISCKDSGSKKYGDENGQILCPVMGNPVKKEVYMDYKGKRISFCCEGCIKEFEKDPEKYMKKLEGVKLDATPALECERKGEHKGHEGHKH